MDNAALKGATFTLSLIRGDANLCDIPNKRIPPDQESSIELRKGHTAQPYDPRFSL